MKEKDEVVLQMEGLKISKALKWLLIFAKCVFIVLRRENVPFLDPRCQTERSL